MVTPVDCHAAILEALCDLVAADGADTKVALFTRAAEIILMNCTPDGLCQLAKTDRCVSNSFSSHWHLSGRCVCLTGRCFPLHGRGYVEIHGDLSRNNRRCQGDFFPCYQRPQAGNCENNTQCIITWIETVTTLPQYQNSGTVPFELINCPARTTFGTSLLDSLLSISGITSKESKQLF